MPTPRCRRSVQGALRSHRGAGGALSSGQWLTIENLRKEIDALNDELARWCIAARAWRRRSASSRAAPPRIARSARPRSCGAWQRRRGRSARSRCSPCSAKSSRPAARSSSRARRLPRARRHLQRDGGAQAVRARGRDRLREHRRGIPAGRVPGLISPTSRRLAGSSAARYTPPTAMTRRLGGHQAVWRGQEMAFSLPTFSASSSSASARIGPGGNPWKIATASR